jgi:hypothetical protein
VTPTSGIDNDGLIILMDYKKENYKNKQHKFFFRGGEGGGGKKDGNTDNR